MSERRMALSIAARLDRLEGQADPIATTTIGSSHNSVAAQTLAPGDPVETTTPDALPDPVTQPTLGQAAPGPTPTVAPAMAPSVPCTKCGMVNDPGAEFCGSCGTFLEWSGDPVVADVPSHPADAVAAAPARRPPSPDAAPKARIDQSGDVTCWNCGTSNPATRTFCRRCASLLQAPELSPKPAAPASKASGSVSTPGPPNLAGLAEYITAYIPTWVVSLFLPLWGALVAAEAGGAAFGQPFKFAIAIATGITAGLWVWSEAYRNARMATTGRHRRRVRPFDALRVGAWEVMAATVAAFAWATAAPSSWASFSSAFWPLATVIGVAVVLGIAGNFLAPLEGGP